MIALATFVDGFFFDDFHNIFMLLRFNAGFLLSFQLN
jgi:hypothetical protein